VSEERRRRRRRRALCPLETNSNDPVRSLLRNQTYQTASTKRRSADLGSV
jgi:hypothetical protein